ncbi:hypothetical protein GOV10_00160 [Candidatus Woesearchaeota archaeon]|nr:hypothetical protein [Candidatus Woesearchaeota archaeon]
MAYILGIPVPILNSLAVMMIILLVLVIVMIWQMIQQSKHMKILEQTTFEIKKYEEEEAAEVHRFEMDIKSLESDEAELFVAKVIPTVTKLENYVVAELMKGKDPLVVIDALSVKGIKKDLASKVVNAMSFYLDYYNKLPMKQHDTHIKTVKSLKVTPPKGMSMPPQ